MAWKLPYVVLYAMINTVSQSASSCSQIYSALKTTSCINSSTHNICVITDHVFFLKVILGIVNNINLNCQMLDIQNTYFVYIITIVQVQIINAWHDNIAIFSITLHYDLIYFILINYIFKCVYYFVCNIMSCIMFSYRIKFLLFEYGMKPYPTKPIVIWFFTKHLKGICPRLSETC